MSKTCKRYAVLAFVPSFIATGDKVGLLPSVILITIGIYFLKRFIETMED